MTHYAIRPHNLFILAVLLLAFLLRVYQLDDHSLRGDEAATVHYAAMPVTELWELSRITDPHPPGYYLLLRPWQWLLGKNAWLMRYTGVMAGLLSLAALYTLARLTLRNATLALFAAALLAVNPFQIWLAQDLRAYSIFMLFGLLSSGALWLALNANPPLPQEGEAGWVSPQWGELEGGRHPVVLWAFYIILTTATLYLHYYAVFLILFQGLFVILNARTFWAKKWPWLVSQIAVGLLILPGLYLASNLAGQAAGGIDTLPTAEILRRAAAALLTGFTLEAAPGLWISLLLAPVWITGLISLLRRNITTGTFWALFFAVPVISVIALSINRPFFKERFFIQALPAFEILLAAGFLKLWRARPPTQTALRALSALLLLTLLAFNLHSLNNYFTDPAYAKAPPWRLYRDYVRDHARPGDLVLTNFPEASVSYYTPDGVPFRVIPDKRDQPAADLLADTAEIARQHTRIWFVPLLRQGFDEQGDVLAWLNRHADRVHQVFFPVYHLNLYLTPPAIDARLIPQPVEFAHGIHLRGFQVFDKHGGSRLSADKILTLDPGGDFTLSLYWQADGPTAEPYTVFTHLLAADGFNQAGQDNPPVWGSYPTTDWQPGERVTDKYTLTLPPGIPPGAYRVSVGWYHSETLARVPLLASEAADHIFLDFIVQVQEN